MISIYPISDPAAVVTPVLLTEELRPLVEKFYERPDVETLVLDETSADDFPAPDPLPQPRPEVGKFFFPVVGARRWARGDFLIAADDLATLRAAHPGETRVTLEFRDDPDDPGSETPRAFDLYVLAARPLVENAGAAGPAVDAYVVTLVDVRYYWQFAQGVQGTSFGSWTALLSGVGTRLGTAVTVADSVDSDYLTPTSRWNTKYTVGVSTAHLLDSLAHLTGSRIVAAGDGTFQLQRPTAARKTAATAFHAANLTRHFAGGLINAADLIDGVPSDVEAVFYGDPAATESVSLFSLGLAGYGGAVGVDSAAWSWVDCPATASGAQRTALATQFATDFYDWQLAPLDAEYAGFTAVPVSGFVGHLEYFATAAEGFTRVRRMPENYGGSGRGRNFSTAPTLASALVEVTAFDAGTRYHTVKRKTWTGSPGDVADYSPPTTYATCRASARTTQGSPNYQIPTGTLCEMVPGDGSDYWIWPIGDYATATTPGLVSTYDQVKQGNWSVTRPGANSGSITGGATITAGLPSDTWGVVQSRAQHGVIQTGQGGASNNWIMSNDWDPLANGFVPLSPRLVTASLTAQIRIGDTTLSHDYVEFRNSTPRTACGLNAQTTDALWLVAPGTSGRMVLAPSVLPGGARPFYSITDTDGLVWSYKDGIWGERYARDQFNNPQLVTISGGIITGWTTGGSRIASTGVVTAANGKVYYADAPVSRTTVYLSPLAKEGDRFEVVGRGAGGWDVSQRAGMTIRGPGAATTTGTGGHLRGDQYESATIECVSDGAEFIVVSSTGTLTWV